MGYTCVFDKCSDPINDLSVNQSRVSLFDCLRIKSTSFVTVSCPTQSIDVILSLNPNLPLGTVELTFELTSSTTTDTNGTNNKVSVPITIERRADLQVSV